jgi:hypothetical protein
VSLRITTHRLFRAMDARLPHMRVAFSFRKNWWPTVYPNSFYRVAQNSLEVIVCRFDCLSPLPSTKTEENRTAGNQKFITSLVVPSDLWETTKWKFLWIRIRYPLRCCLLAVVNQEVRRAWFEDNPMHIKTEDSNSGPATDRYDFQPTQTSCCGLDRPCCSVQSTSRGTRHCVPVQSL